MSKTSRILLALLVATNAVWLFREWGRPERSRDERAPTRTIDRTPDVKQGHDRPPGIVPGRPENEVTSTPARAPPDAAQARANRWVEAMGAGEEERRAALDEMRTALATGDAEQARAALAALWLAPPDIDSAEWRALAERYLDAESPALRRAALLGLAGARALRPEDLAAAAGDSAPDVRAVLPTILRLRYMFSTESEKLFPRLLADPDPEVVRAAIRSLPAHSTGQVQETLASLARDPRWQDDAIWAMAQLRDKSQAVITQLILALEEDDPRFSSAAEGLMERIPESRQAEVADAALRRLEHGAGAMAGRCLDLLAKYGRDTDLPRIERAVAGADVTTRERAAAVAEEIGRRYGR